VAVSPAQIFVGIPTTINRTRKYKKEYFVFMGLPPIGGETPPIVGPGEQDVPGIRLYSRVFQNCYHLNMVPIPNFAMVQGYLFEFKVKIEVRKMRKPVMMNVWPL
jgi:hypothetical protein